jgi:hypothetical protein
MWVVAVWRVGRIRPENNNNPYGLNAQNLEDKVNESISETAHEHLANLLNTLIEQCGVELPQGCNTYGLLCDHMLDDVNIHNLQHLSGMYQSLETMGVNSPFFHQALSIIESLL